MEECLPDSFGFLDTYQKTAWGQILWEQAETGESLGRIKGKLPKQYMLDGLDEEINEALVDQDKTEPGYNRFGALVQIAPQFSAGDITTTAIERHLKEFGDISWYMANFLRLHGITFSRVITPGVAAWELDRVNQPRANRDFALFLEKSMPWINLAACASQLKTAAHGVMGVPRDERIIPEQSLFVASGKFTLSMMHIVQTLFGTTYEAVLASNTEKLEGRIARGVVFDKEGGDDR